MTVTERTCGYLIGDDPCDRTDIKGRGLCGMHFARERRADALDYYPTVQFPPARSLVCRCVPTPTGDECPRCLRLVLTDPERIEYLRARRARQEAST